MSRLPVLSAASAPEASRPLIEKVQANLGFVPNLIGVLAGSPTALETYLSVGAINARGTLSLAEREVVQLTAARIHGCGFCVAGHTATVIKGDVLAREDVQALHHGTALSQPPLQALARFTEAVIASRGAVTDAELHAFLAAGHTERQALDVVLGVSLATLCNFANNLAQTLINPQLQPYAPGTLDAPATPVADGAAQAPASAWLAERAEALDQDAAVIDLAARFADDGLTRVGVPAHLGGDGASVADGVEAIAAVAEQSLAAAFVLWGHRTYIEYLVQSDNPALRERDLPDLLAGRWAGATGMSNAMKFVSGIEALDLTLSVASPADAHAPWRVDGVLPWVTHLRGSGFSVAAAAQPPEPGPVPVFALRSTQAGVHRSADLPLLGLRGSDVAALRLEAVPVGVQDRLHADLAAWLPDIRPPFLGFQCGMSIGLARASLAAARDRAGRRSVLLPRLQALARALAADADSLRQGLQTGRFRTDPAALFRLRIALAHHAQQAVWLELQAWGGHAYVQGQAPGFARRWREAAFIPLITPSLTHLDIQLQTLAAARDQA